MQQGCPVQAELGSGAPIWEEKLSSTKGQAGTGSTTCHPQGQLHSPGSTLLSFLGGRSSVVLETHITFCPPEVFLPSKQLCYCTLQGERQPGVHQQLQLLLLLQPPPLAFTVVIDRGSE